MAAENARTCNQGARDRDNARMTGSRLSGERLFWNFMMVRLDEKEFRKNYRNKLNAWLQMLDLKSVVHCEDCRKSI
jgi:hypothetical protein